MEFESISEAQEYVHDNFENIFIEDVNPNGDLCYIFFSSNGLCVEESVDKYIDTLISRNRYEWMSIAGAIKNRDNIGRFIYVRDAYQKWYIHGISRNNDNIEKTVKELQDCVSDRNWKIVTVGISSGGYMAMIAGIVLHAYKIYNISGQFDLASRMPQDYSYFDYINPGYGNIIHILKEYNGDIYYFCPVGCDHDREQKKTVENIECVKTFMFPDKIHAATVYPFNFPDLLLLSKNRMDKLYNSYKDRVINKNFFLVRTMSFEGWKSFIRRTIKARFRVGNMRNLWDVKGDSNDS